MPRQHVSVHHFQVLGVSPGGDEVLQVGVDILHSHSLLGPALPAGHHQTIDLVRAELGTGEDLLGGHLLDHLEIEVIGFMAYFNGQSWFDWAIVNCKWTVVNLKWTVVNYYI